MAATPQPWVPPTGADLVAAVDALWASKCPLTLLHDLVAIDSTQGSVGELAIQQVRAHRGASRDARAHARSAAQYIASALQTELGFTVRMLGLDGEALMCHEDFSPADWPFQHKLAIVAELSPPRTDPPTQGRSLVINGHVDVVPVAGSEARWTQATPFAPIVRDGRLYGRGAGDMKAGIVAAITALQAIRQLRAVPAATLALHIVPEEECTGNGTLACVLQSARFDACLIPEPFPFLVTAQLGVLWMRLHVSGTPAHVLNTAAGSNAIEAAFGIWQDLKQVEAHWNDPAAVPAAYTAVPHPINFNLGRICGGNWPSSVPSECDIEARIAVFPNADLSAARRTVEACVAASAERHRVRCTVTWRGFNARGCDFAPTTSDAAAILRKAHTDALASSDLPQRPITCTTDGRFYQLIHKTPTIVYGPEATCIHGIDESVSLESVRNTARVVALFIASWCGLAAAPNT